MSCIDYSMNDGSHMDASYRYDDGQKFNSCFFQSKDAYTSFYGDHVMSGDQTNKIDNGTRNVLAGIETSPDSYISNGGRSLILDLEQLSYPKPNTDLEQTNTKLKVKVTK